MIKRLIIVLLGLGVLFGAIFGWKFLQMRKMAEMAAMPQPPAVISTALVKRQTWQPALSSVGSLVATQGVFVANEFAGVVKNIAFESGQAVKTGDVLLQLDDEVDQADLDSLKAAEKLAELEFRRAAKLVTEKSVSRAEYDRTRAALDGARALVASKQAAINKKTIRAPFDGLLGIRQVNLGEYLDKGARIVSLQRLDPIYIDYSLPERYLNQLAPGQAIEVRVQAYPDQTFSGTISVVSARIDAATRSLQIRATLDNPDQLLRPGMFGEVRTLLPARPDVLTLPERVISYNPYGDSVFVVEEKDGQKVVQRRQVTTGQVRDQQIEIIEGLNEGDEVVAAGQNKLRNGQPVAVDNSVVLDGEYGK